MRPWWTATSPCTSGVWCLISALRPYLRRRKALRASAGLPPGRKLLRDAVGSAAAVGDHPARDADDLAVRKRARR